MLRILYPRSIGLSSTMLNHGRSPFKKYTSMSIIDYKSSRLDGSSPFNTFMLLKTLLTSVTSDYLFRICSPVFVSMYFLLLSRSLKNKRWFLRPLPSWKDFGHTLRWTSSLKWYTSSIYSNWRPNIVTVLRLNFLLHSWNRFYSP
jgi:hypothetical protein